MISGALRSIVSNSLILSSLVVFILGSSFSSLFRQTRIGFTYYCLLTYCFFYVILCLHLKLCGFQRFLAAFSQFSRKFPGRCEEKAKSGWKSGRFRDYSGRFGKLFKSLENRLPNGTGVRIPLPAPNKKGSTTTRVLPFLFRCKMLRGIRTAALRKTFGECFLAVTEGFCET